MECMEAVKWMCMWGMDVNAVKGMDIYDDDFFYLCIHLFIYLLLCMCVYEQKEVKQMFMRGKENLECV